MHVQLSCILRSPQHTSCILAHLNMASLPRTHLCMHACMQLKGVHQRSTHKCDRQLANHAAGARPEHLCQCHVPTERHENILHTSTSRDAMVCYTSRQAGGCMTCMYYRGCSPSQVH